jgi:hypothetical protein
MDRRRYIPPSLGPQLELETRQLMSAAPAAVPQFVVPPPSDYTPAYYRQIDTTQKRSGNVFGPTNASPDLPPTIPIRLTRIENLPFILKSYQQNRALPASVIGPIQDDLRANLALLQPPSPQVLTQFNLVLRDIIPTHNLVPGDAKKLVAAFDAILQSAGMSEPLRAKFTADMTTLAALDAGGPEPTIQATNDFAIIAQLTISVGLPLPAPVAPAILPSELVPKTHTTGNHQPTFVGVTTPYTQVVIALKNGGILGTAVTAANGDYSIKSTVALPDGDHTAKALTFSDGYFSLESKGYHFTVVTTVKEKAATAAVPRGPRG